MIINIQVRSNNFLFAFLIVFSTCFRAQVSPDSMRTRAILELQNLIKSDKTPKTDNIGRTQVCNDTILFINSNKLAVNLTDLNENYVFYSRCYQLANERESIHISAVHVVKHSSGKSVVYNSDLETIKRTYFARSVIKSDCNDHMTMKDGTKLRVKIIGVTGNTIYYLTKIPFDKVHKRAEFSKVCYIRFDYKPNNYEEIKKAHPSIEFNYKKIKDLPNLGNETTFVAGEIFVLLSVIELINNLSN